MTRLSLVALACTAFACGGPARTDDPPDDTPDAGEIQPIPDAGHVEETPDAGTPDAGTPPGPQLNWPFTPGPCSPEKPASVEGPGVVDKEDLCTRKGGWDDRPQLKYGQNGYGSIGKVDATNQYPDDDGWWLRVTPGDVVRITVEALPGQDFHPGLSATLNGCSIIHYMSPTAGDAHVATRELFVPDCVVELDLSITDDRARDQAHYGAGAGSTYRVKVERLTKTPQTLAPLPQTIVGDFGPKEELGLYRIDLPNEPGTVIIDVRSQDRLEGAPSSDVDTMAWLFRPTTRAFIDDDVYNSRNDSLIQYDFDPTTPGTPAGPYWVVVDHESSANSMAYDLSVRFEGKPANDVCAGAIDVTPSAGPVTTNGDTRYAQDTFELDPDTVSWACEPALNALSSKHFPGRDLVYAATVPPHQTLVAKLTRASGSSGNPALWLSDACNDAAEAACVALSDDADGSKPENLTWTNAGTAPRQIWLHVDANSASSTGKFVLETSFRAAPAAPANDACAGAQQVFVGLNATQSVTGSTESAANDPAQGAFTAECRDTAGAWSGGDVVYSVRVPATARLRARATPTGTTWNPALWLATDCGNAAACLGAQDSAETPESVAWTNRGAAEVLVYVHVDANGATGGAFRLEIQLDKPIGKDACPGQAASPTTAFLASPKYDVNDYSFSASTVSAACRAWVSHPWLGRDHVYSYVVPAGKRLEIEVKSPISFNGVPVDSWRAMLTTACGDLLTTGNGCVSAGSLVSWANTGSADATIYLVVDTETPAPNQADYNVIPTLR